MGMKVICSCKFILFFVVLILFLCYFILYYFILFCVFLGGDVVKNDFRNEVGSGHPSIMAVRKLGYLRSRF